VPEAEPLATWWRQIGEGVAYIRCEVPARALPGQVLVFGEDDLAADDKWGASFPRQKGAAIWPFAGNTSRGILMAAMREQGVRVLMETDDNYLLPRDVRTGDWADKIDPGSDDHSREAHMRLCKWVDGIIVATENLAAHYSKLNDNIYVCPNSLDPGDWQTYDRPDDGILRIGWGASHSHLVDAPLVQRAFRWASEQPNVEVWVFGIGDAAKFPYRVKRAPWTDDQDEYRRLLATCDVHVCPLYETPWSAGKSDWKALDAAMAGAWPIVSTATPYKPWHDRTMTCTTAKDWLNALKWAVRHRDEIPRLAEEAKAYVTSERLIEHSIHLWRDAIAG